jgi:hypothetical protein
MVKISIWTGSVRSGEEVSEEAQEEVSEEGPAAEPEGGWAGVSDDTADANGETEPLSFTGIIKSTKAT